MTLRRLLALVCVGCGLACGPKPVTTRVAGPDLVALLPEGDGSPAGRARVSNPSGTVDLDGERTATRIVQGQAPTPVFSMSDSEIEAAFGDALASTPLAPQHFVLYFRFESNELTDDSQALLPQVLKAVAAYPAPEVVAVGHTDTSGESQANYELGLNRANAVRALLIGAGLNASLVEVASHGEADPLLPTPDGVLEPRNRRVDISVR